MGTTTSALIWSVADLLRGNFKQSEYGRVILPFTILRRLDGVLEATKPQVLKEYAAKQTLPPAALERFLVRAAGFPFFNTSPFTFTTLLGDAANVRANLATYVAGFSDNVRDLFERFNFPTTLDRLDQDNLLYLVAREFAAMDLHPQRVSNAAMGTLFEELIRKFAELSNETAGEHFTPREVIRLMVELLFAGDDAALTQPGIVRSLYDPTVGTGGMLSGAEQHLQRLNPQARLVVHGQELNPESYAICKADMLIKGQDISNLIYGNTLAEDGLPGKVFDYCLSNPPFGVDWKKIERVIRDEHAQRGYDGRFGPGLPRVSDGSLLFLLHLISKMRPQAQGGGRIGIVLNGSPLFTGAAGSGESEIRRWIIENDWLEAIVALPTDMFYNTGIATYVWLVTNHKAPARRGKIQLINASDFYQKMRKSLGSKRKELGAADIARIVKLYGDFAQNAHSKIFENDDFGYYSITVERPLRDEQGQIVLGTKGKQKGKPLPNVALRDTENVPLIDDIGAYMEQEVLPHVPDAWVDEDKTKVGYEIPFNQHFYQYVPPRPLEEIDADLKALSAEIMGLLQEVTA